ncbi:TetR/AcrR family transcriptional regulator [Shewanella sp. JM162201]|uniref:TetR/AcrR family transcriptional regulator n=1 Tax=Shewanella jiangmenensis TaxID=2837387 RepID=A0ABS5V4Z7_9GAMM|nr:TetR/AcrR family transcriptional regulator [Shewanella jiangmenensis]MBT1444920.1 TetR/AcrR family transcriptional regulator [Shewanella jiangmenensis]
MTSSTAAVLSRTEQKRQAILEAAIELFCGQGFPNTSMDEVARLAGVSKQTVYSHYGNKDDLFIAAIEAKCVMHDITPEMLADISNPQRVLRHFAQRFGEMIVSGEALTVYRACVSQADTHPEISRLYFAGGPGVMLILLGDFFRRVEEAGAYRFGNPRHAATRLCLMLFGERRLRMELGLAPEDTDDERREYLNATVDMFLAAARV